MEKVEREVSIDIKLLKKIMVEKDIETIKEFAKIVEVNRNTVAGILNGKTKPSAEVMYKIAEKLELNEMQAGNIFFSRNLRKM